MTTITAYRGGWHPYDQESAERRIEFAGCLFAHEDRSIAAEYGQVGELRLDASRYLDARDPAIWRGLKGDALKAKDMGYSGVIYPDTHDWQTDGAEIAIFDASTIIFD